MPPGVPVLNACSDRYRFAVGLAACLVSNRPNLLPPNHTAAIIRHLQRSAPGTICLTDERNCDIGLPQLRFPQATAKRAAQWPAPQIPGQQLVAEVFTSGSTGTPVPHRKTWERLTRCVLIGASRLNFDVTRPKTIVATVPPQHMYGLESSVLMSLQSGASFCAERPFYPIDICNVLASAPRPRILVSTPVHLRALLATDLPLPDLDMIISATSPITEEFAGVVEQRFGAPLIEIYGSTETGQIANRQPTRSREWHLWTGVRLTKRGDRIWAEGGHIESPTPLGDNVELVGDAHFVLGSRLQDLVNIAGKRNSIAYLNYQLLSIAGVRDGAFFLPEEASDTNIGVARLSAVVVAPGLDVATVLRHLRERIDPVFLPRPLLLVNAMPRDNTGKLPLQTLRSLLGRR